MPTPHRTATYRTLIGLLAVTGMRIGEAIGLDRDDFDAVGGVLTIRHGKFGKSRELPLHPSTVAALGDYLRRSDRPRRPPNTPALFVSPAGTRLLYTNVQNTFHKLVCRVGIAPRSAACRPRLHDLRHGFAVRTLLDAYRDGCDPGRRLALLSTYLGHVDPGKTYWYLSAAPELLQLAGDRLERHIGGARMTALSVTLQTFFTDRLIRQRQASPHTLAAYRDTLRLMLVFAAARHDTEPSALEINDLDAACVGDFLDHLEHHRGNSARTQNARLAAIRSLFRFAAAVAVGWV